MVLYEPNLAQTHEIYPTTQWNNREKKNSPNGNKQNNLKWQCKSEYARKKSPFLSKSKKNNVSAHCKWNTFLQSQCIIRWGEKNADENNNKNGINNKILRLQYTKINLPAVVIALILAEPLTIDHHHHHHHHPLTYSLSFSIHSATAAAVLVVAIFFTCPLTVSFSFRTFHVSACSRARERASKRMTETYTFRYATTIHEHIKPIKVYSWEMLLDCIVRAYKCMHDTLFIGPHLLKLLFPHSPSKWNTSHIARLPIYSMLFF